MNKQDLVKQLSTRFSMSQSAMNEILVTTFNIIDETVANGETVCISGRRFKQTTRKPRTCRNPKTQEMIQVPERKYIVYRKRIG